MNKPLNSKSTDRKDAGVVVSRADGTVVEVNEKAAELLGEGNGKPCWEVVGDAARGEQVPCEPGCVQRLVVNGPDRAASSQVLVNRRRFQLTCTPLGDKTISTLSPLDEPKVSPGERELTTREIEVLQQLARGLTTGQIADRLGISGATVRTHVEHMRHKLGVATQAALVGEGYRRGYLG